MDIKKFRQYQSQMMSYVNGQYGADDDLRWAFEEGEVVLFAYENYKRDMNVYVGIFTIINGKDFKLTNVVKVDTFERVPDIPHRRFRIEIAELEMETKLKYLKHMETQVKGDLYSPDDSYEQQEESPKDFFNAVEILSDKVAHTYIFRRDGIYNYYESHKGECTYKDREFTFSYGIMSHPGTPSIKEHVGGIKVVLKAREYFAGYGKTMAAACEDAFAKEAKSKDLDEHLDELCQTVPEEEKDIYLAFGKYCAISDMVFGLFTWAVVQRTHATYKSEDITNNYIKLSLCPNFRYHDSVVEILDAFPKLLSLYDRFNKDYLYAFLKGYKDAKLRMFEEQIMANLNSFIELTNVPVKRLSDQSGLSEEDIVTVLEKKEKDTEKLYQLASSLGISTDEDTLIDEIQASIKEESPMFYNGAYIPQIIKAGKEFYKE